MSNVQVQTIGSHRISNGRCRSKRLIPVLADPHKTMTQDDFPWILKHLNPIDLIERDKEKGMRKIAETLLETA